MKGVKSPRDDKRNEVFLSSAGDRFGAQVFQESRSVCGGTFKRTPSQSSLLESISQVGRDTSKAPSETLKEAGFKTSEKENVGETKPIDTFGRNIRLNEVHGSMFLSSLGSDNGRRESLEGTDVCSTAKSKNKKIQQLIQTNAPKMTRNKEYYIEKLIECQNTLRAKDKKLKLIEKSSLELRLNLEQTSASEMMFKTQYQILQKSQSSNIAEIQNLQTQVANLQRINQQYLAKVEQKGAFESNQINQINQINTQNELVEQQKSAIRELERKNQDWSGKYSALESRTVLEVQNQKTVIKELELKNQQWSAKYFTLEQKLTTLEVQNQKTVTQYKQYIDTRDKELETSLFLQKKLEQQVSALSSVLKQQEGHQVSKGYEFELLKVQNAQMKSVIENAQVESLQREEVLKSRAIKLESDIKQMRELSNQQKQSSMKVLGELKYQLASYKTKLFEQQSKSQNTQNNCEKITSSAAETIQQLEETIKGKQQKIEELSEVEDKFKTLAEFAKVQAKEIERMMGITERQEEKNNTLQQTNQSLVDDITAAKKGVKILNKLYGYLESVQEGQNADVSYPQLFETINSILNKQYTIWTPLLQKPKSTSEDTLTTILQTLQIPQTEEWQTKLIENITILSKSQKQLEQLTKKMQEKTKYFETRLHVCKEEDERKTLIISDLKGNIKLTEKSLNETSDKLLKCTTLLEQSNQKVIVSQARLADAKNQLQVMYKELKNENNQIFERNLSVENQVRDLLAKHYEGFYEQIVKRTDEDLLRLDVVLFRGFLNTVIEINHKVKNVVPTSPYMQELLEERNTILAEIRQYYKQILEPEIAQVLIHHKPINQRGKLH